MSKELGTDMGPTPHAPARGAPAHEAAVEETR